MGHLIKDGRFTQFPQVGHIDGIDGYADSRATSADGGYKGEGDIPPEHPGGVELSTSDHFGQTSQAGPAKLAVHALDLLQAMSLDPQITTGPGIAIRLSRFFHGVSSHECDAMALATKFAQELEEAKVSAHAVELRQVLTGHEQSSGPAAGLDPSRRRGRDEVRGRLRRADELPGDLVPAEVSLRVFRRGGAHRLEFRLVAQQPGQQGGQFAGLLAWEDAAGLALDNALSQAAVGGNHDWTTTSLSFHGSQREGIQPHARQRRNNRDGREIHAVSRKGRL